MQKVQLKLTDIYLKRIACHRETSSQFFYCTFGLVFFSSSDIGYPSDEGVRWECPLKCYLNAGEDMVCEREKSFCKGLLPFEKCPLRKGQNEATALCVSQPHTVLSSLLHLCSVVD